MNSTWAENPQTTVKPGHLNYKNVSIKIEKIFKKLDLVFQVNLKKRFKSDDC